MSFEEGKLSFKTIFKFIRQIKKSIIKRLTFFSFKVYIAAKFRI
jgi:hypothetical protein